MDLNWSTKRQDQTLLPIPHPSESESHHQIRSLLAVSYSHYTTHSQHTTMNQNPLQTFEFEFVNTPDGGSHDPRQHAAAALQLLQAENARLRQSLSTMSSGRDGSATGSGGRGRTARVVHLQANRQDTRDTAFLAPSGSIKRARSVDPTPTEDQIQNLERQLAFWRSRGGSEVVAWQGQPSAAVQQST